MLQLNEIVGLGAFIHGVCMCNNLSPSDDLFESAPAALQATAGFAIMFKMYYVAALLFGCAKIITGVKTAAKEIRLEHFPERHRAD